MDPLTWFVAYVMSYVAFAVLVAGVVFKIGRWLMAPVPLKIATTPAPATLTGVAGRMTGEVVFFRSLLRADRVLWGGAIAFHLLFLYLMLGHLIDLAFNGFWSVIGLFWNTLLGYVGIAFLGVVLFLFLRRVAVDYIRYVSQFADYFALGLLFAIASLGLYMRYDTSVSLSSVSSFLLGLFTLKFTQPPTDSVFTLHLLLVEVLMIYLPFSKLMHGPGLLLSPTRNQRDDARARRKVNPWNEASTPHYQSWDEYYQRYKDDLDKIERGEE